MLNNSNNEKGYVFAPLVIVSAIFFVYMVFVGIFSFRNNELTKQYTGKKSNTGSASSPVTTADLPEQFTVTCDSPDLIQNVCKLIQKINIGTSQVYSFSYPKNFTPKDLGTDVSNIALVDSSDKKKFQVIVSLFSDDPFNETEKVIARSDITLPATFGLPTEALEVITTSPEGSFKYYIFSITLEDQKFTYVLKFDASLPEDQINLILQTFNVDSF